MGFCYDQPYFIQVFTMMQPCEQLLCFMLLYISNSSVSISLVGHVLYSANLMFAICFPHLLLMVLEGWRAAITVGTNDGPLTGLSNRY